MMVEVEKHKDPDAISFAFQRFSQLKIHFKEKKMPVCECEDVSLVKNT